MMHDTGNLHADGDGRLTGSDAVEFFKRSGLPREQLAKVWAMADSSRRGFLDQHSFGSVRTDSKV
jgi:Cytoskeletal-regulatory complex EF hand